jgi:hypothetical protein
MLQGRALPAANPFGVKVQCLFVRLGALPKAVPGQDFATAE